MVYCNGRQFDFSLEDFCHRGSFGNTVHGTFLVISPSLWSNIMTITCVVLWLVRTLHLPEESVKKKKKWRVCFCTWFLPHRLPLSRRELIYGAVWLSLRISCSCTAVRNVLCPSGVGERGKKREVKLELLARCVRRQSNGTS